MRPDLSQGIVKGGILSQDLVGRLKLTVSCGNTMLTRGSIPLRTCRRLKVVILRCFVEVRRGGDTAVALVSYRCISSDSQPIP